MELVRIDLECLTIGMPMIIDDCESCASDPVKVVSIEKNLKLKPCGKRVEIEND